MPVAISVSSLGVLDFIAGELFCDEAVVRLVFVERLDDVIAVAPSVGVVVVVLVTGRIRVAHDVQPMAAPTFAVARRFEQPVDEARKSVRRIVGDELVNRFGGRRKPDQVEIGATDQGVPVGARRGRETFAPQGVQQESVDRRGGGRLRLAALRRNERPPRFLFRGGHLPRHSAPSSIQRATISICSLGKRFAEGHDRRFESRQVAGRGRLLAASPGTIAGPCLPPFNSASRLPRSRSESCCLSPWHCAPALPLEDRSDIAGKTNRRLARGRSENAHSATCNEHHRQAFHKAVPASFAV